MQKGSTPLLFACIDGLSDVAQLLINKGASVDVTDEVSYMYLFEYIHLAMQLYITTYAFVNTYP